MRFNFSQKGRQPADTRYAHVKAGLPEAQGDLLTTLVSGSLTASPAEHKAEDLETLRREVRAHDAAFIERLAIYLGEEKNFRELALLLTAELAAIAGNDERTGALVARIIRTPMDIPLCSTTMPGRQNGDVNLAAPYGNSWKGCSTSSMNTRLAAAAARRSWH